MSKLEAERENGIVDLNHLKRQKKSKTKLQNEVVEQTKK